MSRVVIVGRTRMQQDRLCIGGHDLDHKFRAVRLQDRYGDSWPDDAPFRLGQIWQIRYFAKNGRKPHVEDVRVNDLELVGQIDDLKTLVLRHARPWEGSCDVLFDGKVRPTPSGANYIPCGWRVPNRSTGYWIPAEPLERTTYGSRSRFVGCGERAFPWVGVQEPPARIEAGDLVRLSLSRKWSSDTSPEGYYVQISGVL